MPYMSTIDRWQVPMQTNGHNSKLMQRMLAQFHRECQEHACPTDRERDGKICPAQPNGVTPCLKYEMETTLILRALQSRNRSSLRGGLNHDGESVLITEDIQRLFNVHERRSTLELLQSRKLAPIHSSILSHEDKWTQSSEMWDQESA